MSVPIGGDALVARAHSQHLVRFYEDGFVAEDVADFLDIALRTGDAAIVIATEPHRDAILRRLRGIGPLKGRDRWYSGKLVLLDAQDTLARLLVGQDVDESRFREVIGALIDDAGAHGTREVRVFGEMVALLCEQGRHDVAVRLEQLWSDLARRRPFSLLCAYPMRAFCNGDHAVHFDAICALHDQVQPWQARSPLAQEPERALAALQQRTAALEAEVAKRRAAEALLRQREKELADFLENAVEGLHRVGADGTILWANQAELDMLGYAAQEYIGEPIARFHADADTIGRILQRLNAGETLYDEPAALRCKDGTLKHVRIHSNGHFENGQLVYTRCFTRDVTDRVELERAQAERERLLAELTQANRAKDEFLAMLGHELRNPLSPIVTALELLKMRGDPETARERHILERQVGHLLRLVDDLLDVSRITRGKVELRREPLEMADVVLRAVEMASPLLEQRRHRLALEVARDGLRCVGDAVRLAQVVSNLLTNAARYTPPGGEVRLLARREGEEVVVRVRDNGVGLDTATQSRVFDLFFQASRGAQRADGGLGIGLALVKNLVEQHGGTVAAHSEGPGLGSEFEIRLPAAAAAEGHAAAARQAADSGDRDSRRLRILLVDDNVDAAQTLGLLLESHGHEVKVVHDPVAALQAADRFAPALALLDIGLPVMDGYELAARLRGQLGERCRLVALTGYGQERDRARSEVAGFESHLVKPIDPGGLFALLRSCAS